MPALVSGQVHEIVVMVPCLLSSMQVPPFKHAVLEHIDLAKHKMMSQFQVFSNNNFHSECCIVVTDWRRIHTRWLM